MRIEYTAVQRYARKSTEFASRSKFVERKLGRDGKFLSDTGFYAKRVLLNIPVVHA